MIIEDNFDSLQTLWRKRWPFIGPAQKQRLTYGTRVVEVITFKLFGFDVHLSKTVSK